jgi:RNA recognition motif-containing protein
MAQKLYVGNLSYNVSEDAIRDLFAQFGEVLSVKLITDRDTGRPKGFGFVEMENAEEAISALNDKEVEGRPIKVNVARERPPRSGGGGGFNRRGGGGGGRRNFNSGNRW